MPWKERRVRLFGGTEGRGNSSGSARIPRASSGWNHLLASMRKDEGLRVLDIGHTSPSNINFLTSLGHSVYMANLVGELSDPRWSHKPDEEFPTEMFLDENMNFGGRRFDTVLFWDTADYLPVALRTAVVARLRDAMDSGGQLLSFFHIKPDNGWQRFHLRDDGQVDAQHLGERESLQLLNNRQVEQLFADFASYKFFLAKDNLREVVVTR